MPHRSPHNTRSRLTQAQQLLDDSLRSKRQGTPPLQDSEDVDNYNESNNDLDDDVNNISRSPISQSYKSPVSPNNSSFSHLSDYSYCDSDRSNTSTQSFNSSRLYPDLSTPDTIGPKSIERRRHLYPSDKVDAVVREACTDLPSPDQGKYPKKPFKVESDPYLSLKEGGKAISSNPDKEKYPKKLSQIESDSSNSSVIYIVGLSLILVVIASLLFWTPSPTRAESKSPFELYLERVEQLEKTFPSQHSRLWRTVKASARHVLNSSEPAYPMVLLVAAEPNNAKLSACLARLVTTSFAESRGLPPQHAVANVRLFQHLEADSQKKQLDQYLTSSLHDNGVKTFIIDNLQALSGEAALLLHGYCDGDNAPFKDVMLVLSTTLDTHEVELDPINPSSVERHLSQLWAGQLEKSKVDALMSRVANNIVVVTKEEGDRWKTLC